MRFVVFLDALDYKDVQAASNGWLKDIIKQYTPSVPRVTPNVVSQIMTGKRQEDLPFMRSTPFKKPREMFLTGHTILHDATDRDLRVCQYGIPLCANIELPKGNISTYDHFLMQNQVVPPVLKFVQVQKDFGEGDEDNILNAYIDETTTMFASMRNVARNGAFDVFWLGYQPLDAYTHWYDEKRRRALLQVVEAELIQTQKDLKAEIMVFSDHGSTPKTKMFRINPWLKENGWFDYEVNYKLLEHHQQPNNKFPDQIALQSPFVYIDWNKTKFYCNDAFDAMIDATEHATEEDKKLLCKQLMGTGWFDSVHTKAELFDPSGECYDKTPEIIPETSEGVSTSCNIHKNAEGGKNLGSIRTGWHSRRGCVGCTDGTDVVVNNPRDIYTMMKEFISKEKPRKTEEQIEQIVLEDLAAQGYF